jgi:hypothetical protein
MPPAGLTQELYLCHACGSYSWKTASQKNPPTWSELGV